MQGKNVRTDEQPVEHHKRPGWRDVFVGKPVVAAAPIDFRDKPKGTDDQGHRDEA